MKKYFLFALILTANLVFAQKGERLDTEIQTICYASSTSMGTRIYQKTIDKYSNALRVSSNKSTNAQQAATFEVTYNGFTEEAQVAFQAAVDIWATLISSPVTIRINATWSALDDGVLGSAGWGTAFRNFEGAQEINTWYPVALAEKMAGIDLNSTEDSDIIANFSRRVNWYLGTDGNPAGDEFDLVSVVMHEIGHGLGFTDAYRYTEGVGSNGLGGFPLIFDLGVQSGSGNNLSELENPSEALGRALTTDSVFFNSPTALARNGSRPRLFAPATWSNGSSIAHLNESTYPAGNENSLMSPQIGQNEVMHDPGPITLDMFGDMGWEYTYIQHDNLPNSEDITVDSFSVTATINSDVGYLEDQVFLYYSNDNFVTDTKAVQMTATGNTNEFSAQIISTKVEGQVYSYYFTTKDIKDRAFTRPSLLLSNRFFTFQTAQDSVAPEILHNAPNFVRTEDVNLTLAALIGDFSPLTSVVIEYYVNDQAAQTASMVEVDRDRTSAIYVSEIPLTSLALADGDSIRYKITATDASKLLNTTTFPSSNLIKVNVVATLDPVEFYENDFDDITTSANDFFVSDNFSIKVETGFSTGAIHSDHPYANGTGSGNRSDYIYVLRVPIILNENLPKLTFDEVVLVEPGDPGTVFGDDEFWDYVIVEGSNDGGSTWIAFEDGYDSRRNAEWLSRYNSAITDNNSQATGVESLYKTHEIDMLSNSSFSGGEEILIRFRLLADEAAHGWGWAIDNLSIQVDNEVPTILHDQIDYTITTSQLALKFIVLDNIAVGDVKLVSLVNDQAQAPISLTLSGENEFNAVIDISTLDVGDVIKYRLEASDTKTPNANVSYLPSENAYFEIPIIAFSDPQDTYTNDFDSVTDDFVGNIFSIQTLSGFENGAIYSDYPQAFGLDSTSTFTYTLKTPITVSATTPNVSYDEVVLVEPFTDFVAVEVSKDNGANWIELIKYGTRSETIWFQQFQAGASGSASLIRNRMFNLTDNSQIQAGDVILIRFRLERQTADTGFGWLIDNLAIQTDLVTSIDPEFKDSQIQVYPNPVTNGTIKLKVGNINAREVDFSIHQFNGRIVGEAQGKALDSENVLSVDISSLPAGVYLLRLVEGNRTSVHKVIKLD
ncbi:MAG: hypothetical protein ACJAZV_001158 [Roseivirga sp.]|jgi:hypothetical protein